MNCPLKPGLRCKADAKLRADTPCPGCRNKGHGAHRALAPCISPLGTKASKDDISPTLAPRH